MRQHFLAAADGLGFSAKVFSEIYGQASATKMCRSVIIKGMEALLTESMLSARHYGVEKDVLASLSDLLPVGDWNKLAAYMISRSLEHGKRRAEEMREVAQTVAEAGIAPLMSEACVERQDWAAQYRGALDTQFHRHAGCHPGGTDKERRGAMIIDCHGHYTTAPAQLQAFRDGQIAALKGAASPALAGTGPAFAGVSDDEIRASLEGAQLKFQRERGTDITIFSPRASAMGHHIGNEATSLAWTRLCNDLIARVVGLYPDNFVGVCQLPQSPGADLKASVAELERCVTELGFIGCNLNPDPSGGHWTAPPLTDRFWYPVYEKMVELDVPAMVHVSASCNPVFHATGAHYINADTTAFMQFIQGDLFKDFPKLRMIIPHGGGAVPYHWGRYRGLGAGHEAPAADERC